MPKKNDKDWVQTSAGQWVRRAAITMDWVRNDQRDESGVGTWTVMIQVAGCGSVATAFQTYTSEQDAEDAAEELRKK